MKTVMISGVKRTIHIDFIFKKCGKDYIVFREYLPDGSLGERLHTTQKSDLISAEQEDGKRNGGYKQ